jgi:hypothetical protein
MTTTQQDRETATKNLYDISYYLAVTKVRKEKITTKQ